MRRMVVSAAVVMVAVGMAWGTYAVSYRGDWPTSWPKELDELRGQATTMVGPTVEQRHYLIPFKSREKFEAAWPYLLKVKSKGAPIFLVRGPKTDFMKVEPAGVVVHSPPAGSKMPEGPIKGVENLRVKWMNTTYVELAVDGKIVDLNRIELPGDTPIIDERFQKQK